MIVAKIDISAPKIPANLNPITIAPFIAIAPVSYTHLDVYKRQITARSGRLNPSLPGVYKSL